MFATRFLSILYAIASFFPSSAFRPHISSASWPRRQKPNVWKYDGPGETQRVPTTTSMRSQLDTAKLVVSAAIFYVTLQLKIEEAFAAFSEKSTSATIKDNCPLGISYRDISLGSGKLIEEGDEFEIDCKIFYNGIEVVGSGSCVQSKELQASKYPVDVIKEGVKGLRLGGRRSIIVRASDAFDFNSDLGKDIPRESNVILDVKLIAVTKRA